jgi:hypothetical protein
MKSEAGSTSDDECFLYQVRFLLLACYKITTQLK